MICRVLFHLRSEATRTKALEVVKNLTNRLKSSSVKLPVGALLEVKNVGARRLVMCFQVFSQPDSSAYEKNIALFFIELGWTVVLQCTRKPALTLMRYYLDTTYVNSSVLFSDLILQPKHEWFSILSQESAAKSNSERARHQVLFLQMILSAIELVGSKTGTSWEEISSKVHKEDVDVFRNFLLDVLLYLPMKASKDTANEAAPAVEIPPGLSQESLTSITTKVQTKQETIIPHEKMLSLAVVATCGSHHGRFTCVLLLEVNLSIRREKNGRRASPSKVAEIEF
eukprot:768715-Hanusia_phi.AAC.12